MDNAGKLLASIQKDDKKVKEFSDALYKFNTEVTEFIAAYGGETIYAGGDDILALLPVRNRKSALSNGDGNADNLLDLISVINTHFNSTFKDKYQIPPGDNGKSVKLSLSFGVSLQYLKYPLKDALQSAYDSLFDVAKCTKNTLSIIIRKHAGATFQVTLGLDGIADYKDVFKLQSNKAFLPEGFYDSLTKIAAKLARTPANKIDALLKNHFNEDHHKAASCKFDRLEKILRDDLSLAVKTEAKEQAVENIVNLFRLAKLLES